MCIRDSPALGADVEDCFCQLASEEELGWLGLGPPPSAGGGGLDLQRVWDGDVGGWGAFQERAAFAGLGLRAAE
eukprot:4473778-Pyramimonas_sp.AAC.1